MGIRFSTGIWNRRPGFLRQPSTAKKVHCGRKSIYDFAHLEDIGRGYYGSVFRAMDGVTLEEVAVKKVEKERYNNREAETIFLCRHPSVVVLKQVLYTLYYVFMIMEIAPDGDLRSFLIDETRILDELKARRMMFQLFQGVAHIHRKHVIHRDLKPGNLLLTPLPDGSSQIKIIDFGVSIRTDRPSNEYGDSGGTNGYRAPEILLRHKNADRSPAIDLWSVGCIMAELFTRYPLFMAKSDKKEYNRIYYYSTAGVEKLRSKIPLESLSDNGFDLLVRLLEFKSDNRITAEEALQHPWFDDENKLPLPL